MEKNTTLKMNFNKEKNPKKNNGLKGIFYIGSGDLFGAGIVSIFWIFLASIIDAESYGQIHYYLGIAGMAYVLSLIGTKNTITVYTAKNITITPILTLITTILGIISAIIVFLLFYRFDVSFLLIAFIINDISLGYIIGKKFFQTYSKFILIQKSFTLIFGLSFYYLIGVDGIVLGIALSYAHFLIIFYKIFKESNIRSESLNGKYGFILNNYAINIIGGFKANLDKIIIAPMFGLALLGNYALALQFYVLLTLVPMTISKIFLPNDASGNPNYKLKSFTFIIAIIISITSYFLSPVVIPLFFKNFSGIIPGIQILSLGVIPSIASTLFSSRLLGLEKSKHVILGMLWFVLTLIFGIILLGEKYGITGITISYVLGLSLNAIYLALVTKLLKINQNDAQ
jgi:O-antigen/teichoic acid export membrane protein